MPYIQIDLAHALCTLQRLLVQIFIVRMFCRQEEWRANVIAEAFCCLSFKGKDLRGKSV